VSSGQEKIVVKPIPVPFQKRDWFAARHVALKGEWSADPSHVPLGEPITWTLTITADGCLGSQIPDIALRLPPDLRQYPDKPQVSNKPKEDGLAGVKQIKIVLIPAKPGEVVVPEIGLKWWDLTADQPREAKLPASVMNIYDGAVAINDPAAPQQSGAPLGSQENPQQNLALPYWVWGLSALNVLGLAILGFFLCIKLKRDPLKLHKRYLKHACAAHDAKQAETALLAWAGILYPQCKPMNLMKLKPFVPEHFQNALDGLCEAIYGNRKNWSGDDLWKAFAACKHQKPHGPIKKIEKLRELYPSGDSFSSR